MNLKPLILAFSLPPLAFGCATPAPAPIPPATPVPLAWDASPGATSYRLYVAGTFALETTNLTATVPARPGDEIYATAANPAGESAPSNTVIAP